MNATAHWSTTGSIALIGLGAALALMTLVWLLSLVRRDASIVDVFWGLGFILLAWTYYLRGSGEIPRQLLAPCLVTVWGLRLAAYIFWRNRGKGEDYRYAAMRDKRGASFAWISLPLVFWLQAALLWIVSMPLLQVQVSAAPERLTWLDWVGIALFAVGLYFETVGDLQMARFKADPANRGRVNDRGLWRLTRHPNYFGDAMVWWGLTAIGLATPGSLWILISPAVMTFLLMRVSGVALLERGLERTKPQYREYVRRTSAFFPRPPKKH